MNEKLGYFFYIKGKLNLTKNVIHSLFGRIVFLEKKTKQIYVEQQQKLVPETWNRKLSK